MRKAYTLEIAYGGREQASYYWRLWHEKEYIIRRVDSYRLLDDERIERSITFDLNTSKLALDLGQRREPSVVVLPLLLLNKRLHLDVDVTSAIEYQVISCRLVYNNEFKIGKFQFGRDTYRHDIKATGFDSLDKRVHVRVQAPHGMRIAYLELTDIKDGNAVPASHLRAKMTSEFVETIDTIELRNANGERGGKMNMEVYSHICST